MASQVVDALNGRMSNVNMNMPAPVLEKSPKQMVANASARIQNFSAKDESSTVAPGFAQASVEGNLALVIDNSDKDLPEAENDDRTETGRKSTRPHLRLLKPDHSNNNSNDVRAEVWQSRDEVHWLRNPVIFMGLCLVVMVFLILFW
ncbi:MAG: hypothetical protein ACD_39C01079G0002 [uncultured bacterium]|nr:MAG: hypothetical protein ACD_39C01079G0002 [uncultured bacterium]